MTFYNYKTFVKSIKLITLLSLTVVFLSSCDDNNYPYYGGGGPYYDQPFNQDPFYQDPFNTGHHPWNHPGGNYLDFRRRSNHNDIPNVQIGQQQAAQLLERLYQGILFRHSDPQGMHLYVGRVVQGGLHELAKIASEGMARSPEFYQNVGNRKTPEEILNNLYLKIFDRQVDAGGLQEYLSEIPRNTYQVVKYLVLSPEFRTRHL